MAGFLPLETRKEEASIARDAKRLTIFALLGFLPPPLLFTFGISPTYFRGCQKPSPYAFASMQSPQHCELLNRATNTPKRRYAPTNSRVTAREGKGCGWRDQVRLAGCCEP